MIPTSGAFSMSNINYEIGKYGTYATFWLNHADARTLAGVPSGTIRFSDFRGKSWYIPMSATGYGDRYSQGTNQATTKTTYIYPRVTVANGKGPFNYQWSWMPGSGGLVTLSNANSATCQVAYTGTNVDITNYLQCVVTDTYNNSTYTVQNIETSFQIGPAI